MSDFAYTYITICFETFWIMLVLLMTKDKGRYWRSGMGAIYFELLGNLFCSVTFLVLLPPPHWGLSTLGFMKRQKELMRVGFQCGIICLMDFQILNNEESKSNMQQYLALWVPKKLIGNHFIYESTRSHYSFENFW